MSKKWVYFIGSAPSSIHLAPYGNPDWEIWACSPGTYGAIPRSDRFFELHRYEPGQPWFSPEYCEFLKNHPHVYVAEERPEAFPNGRLLPIKEMVQAFSPYFFTSTIAYMFALAILEGYEKIGLAGIDMAAESEYESQRLGCQYFALIAKAKGIEIGVPPESDLFRPAPMYGISEVSHMRIKMMARRRELQQRIDDAISRQQQAKDESTFLRGALEDLNWSEHDWAGNIDSPSNRFLSPPPATALQTFHIDLHEIASGAMEKLEEPVEEKLEGKPYTGDLA